MNQEKRKKTKPPLSEESGTLLQNLKILRDVETYEQVQANKLTIQMK